MDCTNALKLIMSEQRSSGGYAHGREAYPSVQPCLPTLKRHTRMPIVSRLLPSTVPYVDEGWDLHSLLIPVPPPIGELLRDSAFSEGEHIREHRGIRLR